MHLVLTGSGEKPLRAGRHSGLVGRDGQFKTLAQLLADSIRRRVSRAAVQDEIGAQVEQFIRLIGRKPSFIDGHHHAHQLCIVRDALIDLMATQSLPRVTRTTRLLSGTARIGPATLLRQAVAQSLGAAAARAFTSAAIFSNDRFFGMLGKADWADLFPWRADLRRLSDVPPGCVVEWVVHPGLPDHSWAGRDAYVNERPLELQALTDPTCRAAWEQWRPCLTTKSAVMEAQAL